jgi:hypothetical protein
VVSQRCDPLQCLIEGREVGLTVVDVGRRRDRAIGEESQPHLLRRVQREVTPLLGLILAKNLPYSGRCRCGCRCRCSSFRCSCRCRCGRCRCIRLAHGGSSETVSCTVDTYMHTILRTVRSNHVSIRALPFSPPRVCRALRHKPVPPWRTRTRACGGM